MPQSSIIINRLVMNRYEEKMIRIVKTRHVVEGMKGFEEPTERGERKATNRRRSDLSTAALLPPGSRFSLLRRFESHGVRRWNQNPGNQRRVGPTGRDSGGCRNWFRDISASSLFRERSALWFSGTFQSRRFWSHRQRDKANRSRRAV